MHDGAGGISEREYHELSEAIRAECGIVFPAAKRAMLETRLRRRVSALALPSLSAYCRYLRGPRERSIEKQHLIDAVTTHKTDFFREPGHFEYLVREAAPEMERLCGAGFARPLRVWSAACSTGEEPYTLAMALDEYGRSLSPRAFRYQIEASDIAVSSIETARAAIYPEASVAPVPEPLRKRYLLRSRSEGRPLVRVVPELRERVAFRRLNLMDADYGFQRPMDVVFCRNVMIYFQRAVQQRTIEKIAATLRPGGYLMMGHSESLHGLDLPLVQAAPTVYRRNDA